MCTLTYLPLPHENFIITTNRDESGQRAPATLPQIKSIGQQQVIYPKDQKAGGTWVAASEKGKIICLLNGAFSPYEHSPPYRKSRGLVVLDAFTYSSTKSFFKEYELKSIAPFTMVIFEFIATLTITELRWDGQQKHIKKVDATVPHLWSSPNLFNKKVRTSRKKLFKQWLEESKTQTPYDIWAFHQKGHTSKESDTPIRLYPNDKVFTLSTTQLHKNNSTLFIKHVDLVNNKNLTKEFMLSQ